MSLAGTAASWSQTLNPRHGDAGEKNALPPDPVRAQSKLAAVNGPNDEYGRTWGVEGATGVGHWLQDRRSPAAAPWEKERAHPRKPKSPAHPSLPSAPVDLDQPSASLGFPPSS
ncbi:uncharacterized protein LY89DRAFT_676540 [Mollisia scopiformis]|uniref:Uncharacterized protein n=1 Tax=Mollisia scopiformis TaxID=149040 RepID=A0A132B9U4_MOLSC|nr:uncharacterized protein LY89DRAFT_676540 [Mollisia scopiformis]KUJ09180.1 hypothetical protein LY89DRAFT_676540 [Mollisia scopiformis]